MVTYKIDGDVGREHAAQDGVVEPAVHVDQPEVVVMLVQGIALVEGEGLAAVSEAGGVTPPTPGVVAQPLHGAAANGGPEAVLEVYSKEVIHIVSNPMSLFFDMHVQNPNRLSSSHRYNP